MQTEPAPNPPRLVLNPTILDRAAVRMDVSPEWLLTARLRYALLRALRGDASETQWSIVEAACVRAGLDYTLTSSLHTLVRA